MSGVVTRVREGQEPVAVGGTAFGLAEAIVLLLLATGAVDATVAAAIQGVLIVLIPLGISLIRSRVTPTA